MKTYKDLFFTIYCILWLINNCVIFFLLDNIDYVSINNLIMICIFSVITIIRYCSKKFDNWLNNLLKK
jgi:hypothetical protein